MAVKCSVVLVPLVGLCIAGQYNSTVVSHCESENYSITYPELITAPGTRLSCGYFPAVNDMLLFNITIEGNKLAADVIDFGAFSAQMKACGDSDQWMCMTIEKHPKADRIGGVYYYINPDYESSKVSAFLENCFIARFPYAFLFADHHFVKCCISV